MPKFNVHKLGEGFTEPWSPIVATESNDYILREAKFDGEYFWHFHPNSDELILVVKGKINVQMKEGDVILETGEGFTVPKGVHHCSKSIEPSFVISVL